MHGYCVVEDREGIVMELCGKDLASHLWNHTRHVDVPDSGVRLAQGNGLRCFPHVSRLECCCLLWALCQVRDPVTAVVSYLADDVCVSILSQIASGVLHLHMVSGFSLPNFLQHHAGYDSAWLHNPVVCALCGNSMGSFIETSRETTYS